MSVKAVARAYGAALAISTADAECLSDAEHIPHHVAAILIEEFTHRVAARFIITTGILVLLETTSEARTTGLAVADQIRGIRARRIPRDFTAERIFSAHRFTTRRVIAPGRCVLLEAVAGPRTRGQIRAEIEREERES